MRIRLARFLLLTSTVICSLLLSAGISSAQDRFPSKPIQLVAPLAPGTTSDLVARILAERLSQRLGQPVVVQNRTGASGSIAGQFVAKSAPDGYTILIVNSQHSANPALFDNLPYDTLRDFTGVALFAEAPSLIVVPTRLNVKTLKEFIAYAKSRPGALNYGVPGQLTSGHLSVEMLKVMAGIDVTYIPYKGGAPAIADLIAGQIQLLISGPPGVLQHIKTGRLKAIATTAARRSPGMPDTPTFAESGLPKYDTYEWYGVFAPAKIPREAHDRLGREIARIVKAPELSERLSAQGAIPVGDTPAEFDAFIRREMQVWGKIAKQVGLKPN